MQLAALLPSIKFRIERLNRAYPFMQMAVDWHSLALLPALDCGYIAFEVGRDFLPRIQALCGGPTQGDVPGMDSAIAPS